MRRLMIIMDLILGRNIVVYDDITKEVIAVIGDKDEIIKKRYNYAITEKHEECFYGDEEEGKMYYVERSERDEI